MAGKIINLPLTSYTIIYFQIPSIIEGEYRGRIAALTLQTLPPTLAPEIVQDSHRLQDLLALQFTHKL